MKVEGTLGTKINVVSYNGMPRMRSIHRLKCIYVRSDMIGETWRPRVKGNSRIINESFRY